MDIQELYKKLAPLCLLALDFLPPGSRYIPPCPHFATWDIQLNQWLSQEYWQAPAASSEMAVVSPIARGVLAMASVGSQIQSLLTCIACVVIHTEYCSLHSHTQITTPFFFLIHFFYLNWLLAILNSWCEDISLVDYWKSCSNCTWEILFLSSGKFHRETLIWLGV